VCYTRVLPPCAIPGCISRPAHCCWFPSCTLLGPPPAHCWILPPAHCGLFSPGRCWLFQPQSYTPVHIRLVLPILPVPGRLILIMCNIPDSGDVRTVRNINVKNVRNVEYTRRRNSPGITTVPRRNRTLRTNKPDTESTFVQGISETVNPSATVSKPPSRVSQP